MKEVMMRTAHEYPIRLVDKVIERMPKKYAKTVKNVSINEKIFCGHFPHEPILPAIYVVEGMCQTAQIMYGKGVAVTAQLDKFKFLQKVIPGDQLIFEATLEKQVQDFFLVNVKATINKKTVAKGKLTAYQK